MSIFQDNFSSLSELERLAAMAHDPVRVHEIGVDQWPLAMMACAMMAGNDEEKLAENFSIYGIFAQKTAAAARKSSLMQLVRFITSRKGEGWRALAPYAVMEPESTVALKAALSIITLAQPAPEQKLAGVQELVQLCKEHGNPVLLNALLSLGDMRALPLLEPLNLLSDSKLEQLLDAVLTAPNRLSLTWLLNVLAQHPALAAQVCSALCRISGTTPVIIDCVLPIPTWAFEKPTPQPLHGWTPAEYFVRMLPELEPRLTSEQLARVRLAFGA